MFEDDLFGKIMANIPVALHKFLNRIDHDLAIFGLHIVLPLAVLSTAIYIAVRIRRAGGWNFWSKKPFTPRQIAIVTSLGKNLRGPWRRNMPLEIGRHKGIIKGKFITPSALVIGSTGSGKTRWMIRPIVARWSKVGPCAVLSTKGDVIPPELPGTPGAIHLITPSGRNWLDPDGESRLQKLESAGWKVLDERWDPITWIHSATDLIRRKIRIDAISTVFGDTVSSASDPFWAKEAGAMIESAMYLECEVIDRNLSTWNDLLDPTSQSTGSTALITAQTQVTTPGIDRLVAGLGRLTLWPTPINPPLDLNIFADRAIGYLDDAADQVKNHDKTRQSIVSTVSAAVKAYKQPDTSGRPPIDLQAWARSENDLIVIVVTSDQSEAWSGPMSALATALWAETIAVPEKDHLLALDEVANLAPVKNLPSWVDQGRDLGVHVLAGLQHAGQANKWTNHDTAGWILAWPLVLFAAGTPSVGIGEQLARGEGWRKVEKTSKSNQKGGSSSTTTTTEREDHVSPHEVFGVAKDNTWRAVSNIIGPWVAGNEKAPKTVTKGENNDR